MSNWPIYSLVDVTDLITCGVAKRPNYVDSGVPFLSAKNIKNGKVIWSDHRYISQEDHDELTKNNKPLLGDILYTRVGSFGEAAIVDTDKEFSVFVSLTLIKPRHDKLYNSYLKYYLNSNDVKQLAKSSISGSGVGNLNVGTVRKFPIPLPPIPEQKRIVAILDQAFADIEQARAKTEQNLKNARELFESYLQQVFSQRGEGWEDSTLNVVAENLDSKRVPITKKDRIEGDYPYYGASGIVDYVDGYIFDEELLLVSEDGANLLARTYPIAFSASGRYWVNNHAHVLKFKDRNTQKFIEYYLNSISLAPYVSGMAQPKLNQRALNSIPVPKVTKLIAGEVVSKLEVLENEINQVYKIYKYKLDSLDELKKSILQKAFSGELTKTLEVDTNKGAVA